MIEVREILPDEISSYNQLQNKYGSLFADSAWAACFGSEVHLCGIFNNSKTLIGGFIFSKTKLKGYPFYTNIPFTPSIALFYCNPAANVANRLSADKEILDAVARFFRHFRWAVQRYCLPPEIKDMQPFNWNDFKVIPHLTYQVDLHKNEDVLYANLSAKLRNNIKKAKSDGVVLKQITDYRLCEPMILNTYARQKIGINSEHIRNILRKYANPDNSYALAAFREDAMIAVSFFLHDKHTAYYMFGGYNNDLKHEGAGALSVWEAICIAKSKGLTLFDFEGSMIPRIEKYFRGFGGEIVNYLTVNRAPFFMEIVLKLIKRAVF